MKYISLVFLNFLFITSFGQPNKSIKNPVSYLNPSIKGQSLNVFFAEAFNKNITQFDKTDVQGERGVCFLKFQIDSNGKLIKGDFTTGVKQVLLSFLWNTLNETQGYWPVKEVNGRPVRSEYLVLPVYYEFPNDANSKIASIDVKELSNFFNDTSTAEQVTILPRLFLIGRYR